VEDEMAQDTTRQANKTGTAGGATDESRDRYGPTEHYESEGERSSAVSQRAPTRTGEGRGMTAARGGAMSPFGGGYGNPFDMLARMSEEMDRMFESFGFGSPLLGRGAGARATSPFANLPSWGGGAGAMQGWSPRIEVCEREGKLLVQVDLPGVRKEDLSVQIEQDAIVIEGQRRQEQTSNERGYYHSERSYGSFYRTIPLPDGADDDNARARFRDGVLEVEVPMTRPTRGRRLEIQEAPGGASAGGRTYEGAASGGTSGTKPGTPDSTGGSAGSV
jgi:HSP20 family protein